MARVEKISISLTGDLADMVREAVASGDFASASEVIRHALREFEPRYREEQARLIELRRLIQEGVDSGVSEAHRSADEIIAAGRRRRRSAAAG
jgi:antitoxin ParD1/3/4